MNPLQIAGYILGAALTIGAAGIAWHCWTVTQEYATFKDRVATEGKKAKAAADKQQADDKAAKEKADAKTKLDRARIAAVAKQLRDARAHGSFLPAPSPLATSPGRACFDRAEFERATGRLDAGLSQIAEQCDQRVGELNVAKSWAQGLR